jgi:hypothetical protein
MAAPAQGNGADSARFQRASWKDYRKRKFKADFCTVV